MCNSVRVLNFTFNLILDKAELFLCTTKMRITVKQVCELRVTWKMQFSTTKTRHHQEWLAWQHITTRFREQLTLWISKAIMVWGINQVVTLIIITKMAWITIIITTISRHHRNTNIGKKLLIKINIKVNKIPKFGFCQTRRLNS